MRFKIIYVVQGANLEDAFQNKEDAILFCTHMENKTLTKYSIREIRLYYDND